MDLPTLPLSIDHCSVRSGRQLLVSGWAFDADAPVTRMRVLCGGIELPPEAVRFMRGERPDVSRHFGVPGTGRWGFTLVANLPPDAIDAIAAGRDTTLSLEGARAAVRATLKPVHAQGAAGLVQATTSYSPEERAQQRAMLAPRGALDAESLAEVDLVSLEELEGFVRAHADSAWVSPDARAVYLDGWLVDPGAKLAALHVRVGEALSPDLLPKLHRYHRGDLGKVFPGLSSPDGRDGFALCTEVPGGEGASVAGVYREARNVELLFVTHGGAVARLSVHPKAFPSGIAATREMLRLVHAHDPLTFGLLTDVAGHAVAHACRPVRPDPDDVRVNVFGETPAAPTCTVIVPLYGRYDFLYHQLARFSHDPDFRSVDLVYVVDDPNIYAGVLALSAAVQRIYRVPFRVVHAGSNLGYAGANNLGASIALGEQLLLLNSDVLPMEPGWLGRMLGHLRTLPDAGIVGARLLFHDGTVQHDGMRIVKDALRPGLYWNVHPGKGMPPELLPSETIEPCALVTGACMMVARDLYRRVGGLDDGFVLGDFEDSDFCLKVLDAGRRNYLVRDVVLHHLERQSQALFEDDSWRFKVTLYNAWRYGHRWEGRLDAMLVAEGKGA